MSQLDMFGTVVRPATARPRPEDVRPELTAVLERLASSEVMPLSVKDLRFWRVVFPQMSSWLPTEERNRMCQAFTVEVARLEGRNSP
jgi:hypothetical protein